MIRTISNPSPEVSDHFAYAVALTDTHALIGAHWDDDPYADAGTAYLFNPATGALLHTLHHPSPVPGDEFGFSVALTAQFALVGAPYDDAGPLVEQQNVGSVHLFDAATGALIRSIMNPSPDRDDHFGWSVAMEGTRVLVGAPGESDVISGGGAAWLFDTDNAGFVESFYNPEPGLLDDFGWSVALSGDRALIGAPRDDSPGGTEVGAAWLMSLDGCAPTPTPAPTPLPTATPTGAACFPGDADNSGGFVDAADFISVQANFGADNGTGGPGDADCSGGLIDAADFIAVQNNFGADCG